MTLRWPHLGPLAILATAWLSSAAAAQLTIVARLPHATDAFTEGLVYHAGKLYESTGLYGRSSLRELDAHTGRVLQRHRLPADLFGEGLTLVGNQLVQLTWKAGETLRYRRDNLAPQGGRHYHGEGWGLTYDGRRLIMSNGSSRLYFRDPASFRLLRTVTVTEHGRPLSNLNELEYIDGEIWANVYPTHDIVRINPANGQVRARIELGNLPGPAERTGREDVLNGIAYDPVHHLVFVTGKFYRYIYLLRFN